MSKGSKADVDNRANQLNPNNAAYWSSRGGAPHDDPAPPLSPASPQEKQDPSKGEPSKS